MTASNLRELQREWSQQFQKQDLGGWWGLTGFSLQTVFAIDRLVARIVAEETVEGFAIEQLCDYLERDGDKLRMTQVKRTLSHRQLYRALQEAYNIISLCDPAMAPEITFQILCVQNPSNLTLASAKPESVFGEGQAYDPAVFATVLLRFDSQAPILLRSDPTLAVLARLRQAGCRNPLGALEASMGKLFAAFNGKDRDDLKLAIEGAIQIIEGAIQREPTPWRILVADDFRIDKSLKPERRLSARQPKVRDLTANRFDDRIPLIDEVVGHAREWIAATEADFDEDSDQLPVFWLAGEASAGKSVMLLQLMGRLVREGAVSCAAEFASASEATDWLNLRAGIGAELDLGFIDDLSDRMSSEDLNEVARTVFYRTPRRAALLTCGTVDKLNAFKGRKHLQLTTVVIPPFEAEMEATADRGAADPMPDADEIGFVSEPHEFGGSAYSAWRSFAAKLEARLLQAGILEPVKVILALNALGCGGGEALLNSKNRALFAQIEREIDNPIEFRLEWDEDGMFIGHPVPALVVYQSWAGSQEELQDVWARDIVHGVLFELAHGAPARARQAVGGVLDARLLQRQLTTMLDKPATESQVTALRAAFYKKLSDTTHDFVGLGPIVRLLLSLTAHRESGLGDPSVLRERAAGLLTDSQISDAVKADVALGLLLTLRDRADRPAKDAAAYLGEAAPAPSIVAFFVNEIRRGAHKRHAALARRWLKAHRDRIEIAPAVAEVVASFADNESFRLARAFVRRFKTDQASGQVLWAYVQKRNPAGDIGLVDDWLTIASDAFVALQLYERLLRSKLRWNYVDRALAWAAANRNEPGLQVLLALLIPAKSNDPEFGALVEDWMLVHSGTPQADKLLYDLVSNSGTRDRWFLEALDVACLQGTVRQARMIANLFDRAPTLQIFRLALRRMHEGPNDKSSTYMVARAAEALQGEQSTLVPRLRSQCPALEQRSLDIVLNFKFKPRRR